MRADLGNRALFRGNLIQKVREDTIALQGRVRYNAFALKLRRHQEVR
jgi:hypothetical protein